MLYPGLSNITNPYENKSTFSTIQQELGPRDYIAMVTREAQDYESADHVLVTKHKR